MKKLIALLLTIASMFSFFILFNNEKREQQSNMEIAEKNLKYNIRIMIPTKIDSNNADDMLKGIKDTLDKYNASIYYKRLNKGDEVQTEYIYINDDEYLSKFEVTKGRILQKEDMKRKKEKMSKIIRAHKSICRIWSKAQHAFSRHFIYCRNNNILFFLSY